MLASPRVAVVFFAAVSAVAILLPIYYLIGLDLVTRLLFQREWRIAGVSFDQADLLLLVLAAAVVLKGKGVARALRRVPYIKVWLLLGMVLSLAYVTAPINREFLLHPIKIIYQLYRYSWKEILYFPIAAVFINSDRKGRFILLVLVLAADINSALSIIEGYRGGRTGGFLLKNLVGSGVALPMSFAAVSLLWSKSKSETLFWGASLLLMLRGALFSGSRGSFVSLAGIAVIIFLFSVRNPLTKSRVIKLAAAMSLATVALVALRPGILERPTIKRALTATEPMEQSTFLWRVEERWPYFLEMVADNPWLGTGTAVALELGRTANTPHSGYIAYAVVNGIPALVLTLFLIGSGLRGGLQLYVNNSESQAGRIGLACGAALGGILINNVVENTYAHPFVGATVWLAAGIGLAWSKNRNYFAVENSGYGATDDQEELSPDSKPSENEGSLGSVSTTTI